MSTGTWLAESAKSELDSVLSSGVFTRSPRLARLLEYLCTKYFQGELDQIKEYNIAIDVLGRPESFDPSEDAIARVEVHRLRKKLREYYQTEGTDHSLRILIPTGRYVPVFTAADQAAEHEDAIAPSQFPVPVLSPVSPQDASPSNGHLTPPIKASAGKWRIWQRVAVLALAGIALAAVLTLLSRTHPMAASRSDIKQLKLAEAPVAAFRIPSTPVAAAAGGVIRIGCGRQAAHVDRLGRSWGPDRYFVGGASSACPHGFLARTSDPSLFDQARTGDFTYEIPLPPGVYELHLYFVETTFGPGTSAGGGENNRVFHVAANGKRILSDLDILSDAGGPSIADERVFKDIGPAADGLLHLRFMSARSQAMVNAIFLEPARPHQLNPVRILEQDKPYTDSKGYAWTADNYWSGGQIVPQSAIVQTAHDRNVYASERYGNFSYAIPVDEGEYAATLHFAENYWGRENPGGGGIGSRIFDVFSNGAALLRDFDIYKETGANRALVKTFHHLKPSAQGKLLLSFVPVKNYASIYAIEVVDESRE